MSRESAVRFDTLRRVHFGFAVRNLQRSIEFYRILLSVEPSKTRGRYARFEVSEPPLNLSLNEVDGQIPQQHSVTHFGIQVKSTSDIETISSRLKRAGLPTREESNVSCCHSVQDKVWVSDPDGNAWEIYVVLDDHADQYQSSQSDCCADSDCCSDKAVNQAACPTDCCGDQVVERTSSRVTQCCAEGQTGCCDAAGALERSAVYTMKCGSHDCTCAEPCEC